MPVLTATLALTVVLSAIGSGRDARGWHVHPLPMVRLMGVNGAFLTGAGCNPSVFCEVPLIAFCGPMIHSGGAGRLRAGMQHVVTTRAGSTLFLFAPGTLCGMTGTLNMAGMAVRVSTPPAGDEALLFIGAPLLLIVFAVKAAAFPVQFWLPAACANARAPVAAVFAIMTKVDVCALLRMFTLVVRPQAPTGAVFGSLLLPAALATPVLGALGVMAAQRLPRLLASVGTLPVAVAPFDRVGLDAALYDLVHSTIAAAGLLLVADMVRKVPDGAVPHGLVAGLYVAAAIAMAGMPPLSGFPGRRLVLQASGADPRATAIRVASLVTSLSLIVTARRSVPVAPGRRGRAPPPGVGPALRGGRRDPAGASRRADRRRRPATEAASATASQLLSPGPSIAAVLGQGE